MNALANDPSRPLPRLRFDGWPEAFRDSAKHLAYVLINYGNPEILTDEAHGNYVKWPQAGTIERGQGVRHASISLQNVRQTQQTLKDAQWPAGLRRQGQHYGPVRSLAGPEGVPVSWRSLPTMS